MPKEAVHLVGGEDASQRTLNGGVAGNGRLEVPTEHAGAFLLVVYLKGLSRYCCPFKTGLVRDFSVCDANTTGLSYH
jgi:hypothetical protein